MKDIEDKVMKGTTTLGIVCKDGLILASEKREVAGYIVSEEAEKIYKINEFVGMAGAGLSADLRALAKILEVEARLYRISNNKVMSPEAAASLLSNLMFQYKMIPFMSIIILGGVDEEGVKLFALDVYGGITRIKDYTAFGGSGWPLAQAVLDSEYSLRSVEENIPLAIKAISAAKKRDVFSGGDVDILVITKKGSRKISEEELSKYIKKKKE
ncbi:MAG: proteasome subunit beta [Candidatus Aenigmatarchaeota archaeon]